MGERLFSWETWHWRDRNNRLWPDQLSEIDHILDSQRRTLSMLADGDCFYSRTDLRMLIDGFRTTARTKILEHFSRTHPDIGAEVSQDLVLHAAANIKVSPLNTMQMIKDYPDLVCQTHPEGSSGSLPLHFAAAAVGSEHLNRVRFFLEANPEAIKLLDERGMMPMHIALVNGAGYEVMKLFTDAFPPALEYPLLPRPPVPEELEPLVGLLPFHIACCRNDSLDVIFQLLVECPGGVSGERGFEKSLGDMSL